MDSGLADLSNGSIHLDEKMCADPLEARELLGTFQMVESLGLLGCGDCGGGGLGMWIYGLPMSALLGLDDAKGYEKCGWIWRWKFLGCG